VTGSFVLATTKKTSTASKTQKVDSKPAQGASASNQSRVSSAVQVISLSITKIHAEF
jgi:hypothetical protein